MRSPSSKNRKRRGRVSEHPCQNLYRFIRLVVGEDIADRELARRWAMEWKSFVGFKQGRRRLPRVESLEALATSVLHVDPAFVFQVCRGVPAEEVAAYLSREHRLRALLERVNDAIFTVDPDGRLQDVNARFCQLVGRAAHELLGTRLRELAAPASVSVLVAGLAVAARDGEVRGIEVALVDASGAERIMDVSVTRIVDAAGTSIGAQAIAHDVTQERQLVRDLETQRRQLEAERSLLQMLYDCVPAACILFDRDGTIRAANALVDKVCPILATEMVGRNAIEVFGNPGAEGSPVTRAFSTGQIEQQVSLMTDREGEARYVYRVAGPVVTGGHVERVIEILVDVTEQVRQGDLRILSPWGGQASTAERRSAPRVPAGFLARYSVGKHREAGQVENLGAGGLFLATQVPAAVGDEIEVEWAPPGTASPVRARGIVAWTQRAAGLSKQVGIGVRFVTVGPARPRVAGARKRGS